MIVILKPKPWAREACTASQELLKYDTNINGEIEFSLKIHWMDMKNFKEPTLCCSSTQ